MLPLTGHDLGRSMARWICRVLSGPLSTVVFNRYQPPLMPLYSNIYIYIYKHIVNYSNILPAVRYWQWLTFSSYPGLTTHWRTECPASRPQQGLQDPPWLAEADAWRAKRREAQVYLPWMRKGNKWCSQSCWKKSCWTNVCKYNMHNYLTYRCVWFQSSAWPISRGCATDVCSEWQQWRGGDDLKIT